MLFPLNVTHTALFLRPVHCKMLQPNGPAVTENDPLPEPATTLRKVLHTNMTYYAETYRKRDNFDGPPCHDALTVAYLAAPHLFQGKRHRVDVELNGTWTAGTTVVDIYGYRHDDLDDSWGPNGKNVYMIEEVNVDAFWAMFLDVVDQADYHAVINRTP